MRTTPRLAIGLALIIGPGLVPAAASAATHALHATHALAAGPAGGDPDTTVTFAVTSGALTMTAPASASLGSDAPGTTISGALGSVVVTDTRALLDATWTVIASSTTFTTGGATSAETIPATDATYDPGAITHTGNATQPAGTLITLSGATQTVVTGSSIGNSTATWDPTIAVHVPAAAVGGTYTSTLTQSVS